MTKIDTERMPDSEEPKRQPKPTPLPEADDAFGIVPGVFIPGDF